MTIARDDAANVLHYFGRGGYPGGSFTGKLIDAAAHADESNRARLALGFPSPVAAVVLATQDVDGIDTLQRIVEG